MLWLEFDVFWLNIDNNPMLIVGSMISDYQISDDGLTAGGQMYPVKHGITPVVQC